MRAYETIFIVDTDVPDDDVDEITEKFTGAINDFGGRVIKIEKWGKKKLAYRVKNRTKGNYILLIFLGDRKVTIELERILKIDDRILKYLTVRVDKKRELDLLTEEPSEEDETEENEVSEEDVEEE